MSKRLTLPLPEHHSPGDRAWVTAVVALGANLGERRATFEAAVTDLRDLPLVEDVRVAPPIESIAVTVHGPDADAPRYLNSVALVRTRLAPTVLLRFLHAIEDRHGRVRRERWGERTLDLDLIAYGDVRADGPGLVLPHPRAAERSFVLRPWAALDPAAELPGVGPVADLLAGLEESS